MFDEAISLFSIWASMNTWLTPTFLFLFLNLMIGTIFITSSFNSPKPNLTNNNYHDTVHSNQQQQEQSHSQLTRAPSVLQRLKSINFYSYYSQNLSQASDPFSNPKPELELKKVPTHARTQAQTYTRVEPPIRTQTRIHNQNQTQTQARNLKREEHQLKTQAPIQTQTQTRPPAIEEDFTTDDEVPTLDEVYNRIKGISSTHHNRQKSDTVPRGGEIPGRLPAKMHKSASDKSAFNHFAEIEAPVTATATAAVVTEEVDARADDFINRFKKQLQLQRIKSIVRYKDMIAKGSGK